MNQTMEGDHLNGCGGTEYSTNASTACVDKLEPIAIIGFSMRFPQEATSPEGFWSILSEGRSVMTEVPPERFNINGFYHPDASHPGTINARGGHFLKEDIAAFDAPFFSMNPSEVECMDPQQRCLLETSYHALENAGIPIQKAAGTKTSVYVGSTGVDYKLFLDMDEEVHPTYKASGTGNPILSNRLSWFYDLKGPSMTIETACSSSMVALHLACQSLRARESTMSLVCGAQLYLEPSASAIPLSRMQFISSDSRCFSFDERGNGYAKGEGFGILVLKPLADALAAGDTIRAVIRSTATNQDGRTPGLTQPSSVAQEEQIRDAYRTGGLDLCSTRLFEAHGTGTTLGDPIEAEAIRSVFQEYRSSEDPMYVGAVKSNIGHLEAAAGVAAVIKVILCLERGIIPPNAGFETLNHRIQAEEWHLRFPSKPTPWPTRGLRRASINSFGYGGSNAHIVLDDAYNYLRERHLRGQHCTTEEPPDIESETVNGILNDRTHIHHWANGDSEFNGFANGFHDAHANGEVNGKPKTDPYIFVWSTSDAAGIKRVGSVYKDHLSQIPPGSNTPGYLRNLAYTLSNKRSVLPWKSYLVAKSLEELQVKLENMPKPSRPSVIPRLHFVFTGQGAQWANMGLELLAFPEFRQSLSQAESHFKLLGSTWSLIEEMGRPSDSSRLDDPALAQPVCTALQVALVELLTALNVRPWGIVGHSSGEIAAAFCAGAISRQSAWTIAYFRGTLAARLATAGPKDRGAMISVQLSELELQPYFKQIGGLSVGCENSPSNTTVTGRETSIDYLKEQLDRDGIFARKLRIPVAYHSSHMQVIAKEYQSLLSIDRPQSPISGEEKPLFVSSVTGDRISSDQLCEPDYWVQNLVSRVKFSEAMRRLHSTTFDTSSKNQANYYIEIGPHAALQGYIKDAVQYAEGVQYDSVLRRGLSALETLANLAGKLFVEGYPVDIERVNGSGLTSKPARMLADLPEYPFNHSQRYWLESRLFKNYRQRDKIRHELLGLPSTDCNPFKPRWRHTLRVSDLPWIKDHQVNGSVVYPAAGMLAMVIEAARSASKPGSVIRGYRFWDVVMSNALVIPSESGGLEVQLYMQNKRHNRTTGTSAIECREFCLYSCVDDEWRDACSGTIVTEFIEKSIGLYDAENDALKFGDHTRARYQEALKSCSAPTTQKRLYEMYRQIGYEFGPAFQTLHDIAYDPTGCHAVGTIILDEWVEKVPSTTVQDHVIHPTTLDGVLQTIPAMTCRGGSILGPLNVPTQIREFWISHSLLSRRPSEKIRVAAKTDHIAIRDTDASIVALHSETLEPVLLIDGFRVTAVSSQHYTPPAKRDIFYTLEWRPDVELLRQLEKEEYCLREIGMRVEWEPSRKVVCLHYMAQALRELEDEGFGSPKGHFRKYLDWVRLHLNELGDQNPLLTSPWKETFAPENREQYLSQFAARGPVERATYLFCSQLTKIIREEIDPLDLLFNKGLAKDLYSEDIFTLSGKRVAAFIDLVAHKNPNMAILEIGAGTGSITNSILPIISQQGNQLLAAPKYDSYTFTDISPSFFEKAKTRFAPFVDHMNFKILDIEQDPAQQGYELGKYDLVLAGMVLHATVNIAETLRNAKSLLKPGGYLVLVETTNKYTTVLDCIWGTLPGWLRAVEEDRKWSPLYSQSEWDSCLQQAGFTGIELALPDHSESQHHILNVLVSRVAPTESHAAVTPPTIIISAGTELQQNVAIDIASYMRSTGVSSCDIVTPKSLLSRNDKDVICVSLLDLDNPFLSSMTDDYFATFKKIVESSRTIYWITSGSGARARQPEKAMASGFSRAITQEYPGLRFANIDVDGPMTAAETFRRVFERSSLGLDADDWESDYLQSEGIISIPRVVEASDINSFVHSQTGQPDIEKTAVGKEPTEALKLEFSVGHLDSFRFARDETINVPLTEDEVEIQVKATGINSTDVMVILGQMAGTHAGCEYSGVVSRVGSAVKNLSPGDRVCCMASAGFKTFVRSKEHAIVRIPNALPFTEAFPVVYLAAIYSINHVGRLQEGESILIHAAAGAVGQTAIQLAQHIGAEVFVTVSSTEKRDLIKRLYGIPDNRIFFSRNLSFERQIMHATNGRGVDVVLNSLSGEGLAESWRTLAPLGRFVEIGKRDIQSFQSLPMQPFSKNVSYHSVDLEMVCRYDSKLFSKMVTELEDMLSTGILSSSQPVKVFTRAEFESAIQYLQTGQHMGKAVIDWEAETEIPIIPSPNPEYSFDPNASYVIAGGLGGIGRSLASWFASRGAKHLILLSRSGANSKDATKLLADLASRGVHVATPQCDVVNAELLEGALRSIAGDMPPIKGCIQASMVLKDRLLQNMTRDEWQAVLDPKLTGTWNLHNVLPRNMDFFVILSSLGGMMGTSSQSQYNAVSTFQDAFARHRWSRGEKCISIDVGLVTGVGYVAEHGDIAKRWSEKGLQILHEQELHSVVDWACNPARNISSPWSTQVITGAGMPAKTEKPDVDASQHLKRPLYRHLQKNKEQANNASQVQINKIDYSALLREAGGLEEASSIIATALATRLARALSVPQEDIDTTKPAHSYGVDSLVAINLRFWFQNEIKADISVFNVLSNDSIVELARLAASKSEHLAKSA
ncbi:hypothetical protein F4677DRAFT_464565 [Hypoxylon crocopeplum]|nr:hypothetical protein F4677DRAFT_464565 [Hypoxylon crocopeplum]